MEKTINILWLIVGLACLGQDVCAQNLEVEGDAKIMGRITDVQDPIAPQDVATKAYVDALETQLTELQLTLGLKIEDIDGNL